MQKVGLRKSYVGEQRMDKKEIQKRYREKNKEKIRARGKLYYLEHKEEIKAKALLSRDKILQRHKEYYQENKDKFKAYCEEHREERTDYMRIWRIKNRDKIKKYNAERRLYSREWERKNRKKIREEVLIHYSKKDFPECIECGICDIDVLCIDHINGGGKKEREKWGNGAAFYKRLKKEKYPLGYQILCWNCNHKKLITEGC